MSVNFHPKLAFPLLKKRKIAYPSQRKKAHGMLVELCRANIEFRTHEEGCTWHLQCGLKRILMAIVLVNFAPLSER